MTYLEYETKLNMLFTSDAPSDVKDKAIQKLRQQYDKLTSVAVAMKQLEEAKADFDEGDLDYD